jgi:site-specific recombinase XerD
METLKGPRDLAMFMLMLRCGLRVEEVANLTLGALDFKQRKITIIDGKGAKDRIVMSAMMPLLLWCRT